MYLKHVNAIIFITVLFLSVVHNLKHGSKVSKQDPILSEIKRNITIVNHVLEDLMKKYDHFKLLAEANNERTEEMRTKLDDTFEGDPYANLKAHFNKIKSHESYMKTLNNSDKTSESGDLDTSKDVNKMHTYEGNISLDSEVDSSNITYSQYPESQDADKKKSNKRILNKTAFNTHDYLSEKNVNDKLETVNDSGDVEKVLVIHLGSTEKPHLNINRASSPKHVFIQVTNKEVYTPRTHSVNDTEQHDSDLEEEKAMQIVMLRVKSLRAAYGDACYTVVANKCQRALKSVLKDICKSGRKCTDIFNDDFRKNGISSCEKEFGSKKNRKRGRNEDSDDDSDSDESIEIHQQIQQNPQSEAQFIDYTRQGFLDMTCLHALSSLKEPSQRTEPAKTEDKPHEVHILRDRYEKACKKASFDKCKAACKSASDTTCTKHDCVKEKKKALKNSCNRRCKQSFSYQGDDSNSESDSDSDSDYDDTD